jgi:N-acetylmuramidase/Putative peptidoglycan binding domain
MPLAFQGTAWALSSDGLVKVAGQLGVSAVEIWTVLAVETSGCGYLADRRPQILYERHIFHRLTKGEYSDGDVSHPKAGGYGPHGAPQYERLGRAVSFHRSAALRSASWGIGQIMGENFAVAGFQSEEAMVDAMLRSEDEQLTAMGAFLANNKKLQSSLRSHDWATFARHYNGPNYETNKYDLRLNDQYQKFASGKLPDLNVRAAQLYLTYHGFKPGPVDGTAGRKTLLALASFEKKHGLEGTPEINQDTVAKLRAALPSGGRAS